MNAACAHESASFDRTLCACGSMHDYCDSCGAALGCPLDENVVAANDPDGPEAFEGTLTDGLENDPPYPSAVNAVRKPGLGFTVMRIKRLRRSRWFWFRLNIGFGKRGLYVERY